MPYTEADLTARITALETALDRHEQTVQFADRSVTFSTTDQIVKRIEYFKDRLREVQVARRRSKRMYGVATKGF